LASLLAWRRAPRGRAIVRLGAPDASPIAVIDRAPPESTVTRREHVGDGCHHHWLGVWRLGYGLSARRARAISRAAARAGPALRARGFPEVPLGPRSHDLEPRGGQPRPLRGPAIPARE